MLVLSRKANQAILIGDNIRVVVTRIKGGTVGIAIDAPHTVQVLRAEVQQKGHTNGEAEGKRKAG